MKCAITYSFAVFTAIASAAGGRMVDAKHNLLSRQQQCLPEDHCINGKDLTTCDMCCSGQCKQEGVPGCGVVPGSTIGPGCAGGPSPAPGTCLPAGHCISGKDNTKCSMCCSGFCVEDQYGCGSAPGQDHGSACAEVPVNADKGASR
ncbi:unnamed protein product [Cercospora beticola]|nr:unnamed protein product [Cercospora beticola]